MSEDKKQVSRRDFLKFAGAAAIAVQVGAVAKAGFEEGRDPASYTGWEHLEGQTQFFNRKPYETEELPYSVHGETRRPKMVDGVNGRNDLIKHQLMVEKAQTQTSEPEEEAPPMEFGPRGVSLAAFEAGLKMPELENIKDPELYEFYVENPDHYELDKYRFNEINPQALQNKKKYESYYSLINAYEMAWFTGTRPTAPPEVSDFNIASYGAPAPIPTKLPFKSEEHASKLIKKMAHLFGATLVGITKLNPDWVLDYSLRGSKDSGSYEVPEHWEYVIAIGIPHEWDMVLGNPHVGLSADAYSRATVAAERLEKFIKGLGYPARAHTPMSGYDLIGIPILQDAGLGTVGRHGIVISPEVGSNMRASFVTTSLPMELDKPIDFGVRDFCKDCKICAEICPSQSISYDDDDSNMIKRGYQHWEINQTSCKNFWHQSQGGVGCRVCLIACPYSRRNNWAHDLVRKVDLMDPTGLANNALIWGQKTFFENPEPEDFLPPPDGTLQNYRDPAEWLTSENYLDIEIVDPTKGD